jgi:hypothetical protein
MDLDRLGRGDMLDQGLLDRAFRYSGTKILTPTEAYRSGIGNVGAGIRNQVASRPGRIKRPSRAVCNGAESPLLAKASR